jgi:hypothetical protein
MALNSSNKSSSITYIWLVLIGLTLTSAFIAEGTPAHSLSIIFVCFIIVIKGQLVIDRLIGLRLENQKIRWVMLAYFYILPQLFVVGILFPELLRF